jgi:hypothetical protein
VEIKNRAATFGTVPPKIWFDSSLYVTRVFDVQWYVTGIARTAWKMCGY